jgi:hypothetical protein
VEVRTWVCKPVRLHKRILKHLRSLLRGFKVTSSWTNLSVCVKCEKEGVYVPLELLFLITRRSISVV